MKRNMIGVWLDLRKLLNGLLCFRYGANKKQVTPLVLCAMEVLIVHGLG